MKLLTYEELTDRLGFVPDAQKEAAIKSVDGATLLLAVPGSGKTTALVARLGYMICCLGIDPRSILTMTYTVAATADMRARFVSIFGEEYAKDLEFRTINGVCSKIILQYAKKTGAKPFELAEDDGKTAAIISSVFRKVTGEYASESDLKEIRTAVTYAKNMMLDENGIRALDDSVKHFSEIYAGYRKEMRAAGLMDYDDQLTYALHILERYPGILRSIRGRYRYIAVDEAQDTSYIQHRIISLLAGDGSLFMVGDEDQSIYGFRAAYPRALLDFEADHPGGKILKMEDNYRSVRGIVAAADAFIRGNKSRYPKVMRAVRKDTSGGIAEIKVKDRREQYSRLLREAAETRGVTAVLYRENECALPLVDLFDRRQVRYTLRASDFVFFSDRVVRDIEAALSLALDGKDTGSYMRIYYKIWPYLGKQAAEEVCSLARSENIGVFEAIRRIPSLKEKHESARLCSKLLSAMSKSAPDRAVVGVLDGLGYSKYLERNKIFTSKPEILMILAERERTVGAFLWRLTELERLVRAKAEEGRKATGDGGIILSTVHMAKGLEYGTVWLLDVCDEVIPGNSVLRDYKQNPESYAVYEEERRIFYVAVTRAKDRLFVFTRRDTGTRFANELIECRDRVAAAEKEAKRTGGEPVIPGSTVRGSALKIGMRVSHKWYGPGTVSGRTDVTVSVKFDIGTVREFVAASSDFDLI